MAKEMSKILVRTRCGEFEGELDDSDVSNAIWLSNSLKLDINMLGGMMYGDLPLDVTAPEGERVRKVEVGDIAYWPKAGAFCIFFGPTPLSEEDGKPVAPYPVVKIGRMIGDCSGLEHAGDRQTVTIVQSF